MPDCRFCSSLVIRCITCVHLEVLPRAGRAGKLLLSKVTPVGLFNGVHLLVTQGNLSPFWMPFCRWCKGKDIHHPESSGQVDCYVWNCERFLADVIAEGYLPCTCPFVIDHSVSAMAKKRGEAALMFPIFSNRPLFVSSRQVLGWRQVSVVLDEEAFKARIKKSSFEPCCGRHEKRIPSLTPLADLLCSEETVYVKLPIDDD